MKKIIPFLLFCILLSGVSAFSDDHTNDYRDSNIWDVIVRGMADSVQNTNFGGMFQDVAGLLSSEYCPNSSDNFHHATNLSINHGNGVDDRGNFVYLTCDHCNRVFKCYASDLQAAYDAYASSQPWAGITDEGNYLLKYVHEWSRCGYYPSSGDSRSLYCEHLEGNTLESDYIVANFSCSDDTCLIDSSYKEGTTYYKFNHQYSFNYYRPNIAGKLYVYYSDGQYIISHSRSSNDDYAWVQKGNFRKTYNGDLGDDAFSSSITVYKMIFVPDNASNRLEMQADTRITNYNLNIATTDSNNNITNVYENTQIINEGDKTLYIPITNSTYDIDTWQYEYTDRSVSGELDIDNTLIPFVVIFGDDGISISIPDLDIDLDLSYVVEQEQSHQHNYIISSEDYQPPTCTDDGLNTFICQTCGDTYTETVPALGHDWELVGSYTEMQTVEHEEPEEDEEIEVGYILYRCTRCGEERKDYTGMNIESSESGMWATLLNWLERFKIWLGIKLDEIKGGDTYNDNSINDNSETINNIYDYEINYFTEDGEEDSFSIRKMINKFRWIKDVFDIGKELVAVVSYDAAAAYDLDISGLDSGDAAEDPALDGNAEGPALDGSGIMVDGAPYIPINLAAAQSHYGVTYGGEQAALDLSWYAPYKQTVDNLVGGFLWIFFAWKLFQKAPGIIGGVAMDSSKVEDIKEGERHRR